MTERGQRCCAGREREQGGGGGNAKTQRRKCAAHVGVAKHGLASAEGHKVAFLQLFELATAQTKPTVLPAEHARAIC